MGVTYVLRFNEATAKSKSQRSGPSGSKVIAFLKIYKMQTGYFTDQNLNIYSSGLAK